MNTISTFLSVAALIGLFIALTICVIRYRASVKAEEQAERNEKYAELMEKGLKERKDTPFILKSGKVKGHIKNYDFFWLEVEGRTYTRLKDLFAIEQLHPEDIRELQSLDRTLQRIRSYYAEEVEVKPKGYIDLFTPRLGRIVQYTPGVKIIGDTNRVGIIVAVENGGHVYIDEVHVSINLTDQLHDVYKVSTKDGLEKFRADYSNNKDLADQYLDEFHRLREIEKEIRRYNEVRADLVMNNGLILEHRPNTSKPSTERKNEFKDAPRI